MGAAVGAAAGKLTLFGQIGVALGVSVGSAVISRIITPKPKVFLPGPNQTANPLLNVRSTVQPWRIIFGRARVGGTIVFAHYTGNFGQYLNLVIVLAAHRVNDIGTMYADEEEVSLDGSGDGTGEWANAIHVETADGTHVATFNDLVTETTPASGPAKWTTSHKLLGRAHVWIRVNTTHRKLQSGLPRFTWEVEGYDQVYDPRGPSSGYSANAALCIAEYLRNTDWGLGDDLDESDLQTQANICDESVSLDGGGSEDRYTCNGTFSLDQTPEAILAQLLSSCGGRLARRAGLWQILPAAYATPTITLTEDDARGPIQVQPRLSRRELANTVRGTFVSPDHNDLPTDYPPITNSTYLTEDGSEELARELDLPFTQSAATAQRLAKIELERTRQQITVEFPAMLGAYRLQAGDTLYLTIARLGWTAKAFDVIETRLVSEPGGALGVDLTLRETASAVYSWSSSEESALDAAPDTDLINPFLGIDGVSGFVVNPETGEQLPIERGRQCGTAQDGDTVTFSPPFTRAPFVSFEWQGITTSASLSAPYHPKTEARDLDGDGFTMVARLTESVGALTGRTASLSTPSGTPKESTATKTETPEAWDDKYTFGFSVTLSKASFLQEAKIVLDFYTRPSGGGAWTLRATWTRTNTDLDDTAVYNNQAVNVNVDGLAANSEFKIVASTEDRVNSFTTANVSWDEAAAPSDVDGTPNTDTFVRWTAVESPS